jgi:hypothetical protein
MIISEANGVVLLVCGSSPSRLRRIETADTPLKPTVDKPQERLSGCLEFNLT